MSVQPSDASGELMTCERDVELREIVGSVGAKRRSFPKVLGCLAWRFNCSSIPYASCNCRRFADLSRAHEEAL